MSPICAGRITGSLCLKLFRYFMGIKSHVRQSHLTLNPAWCIARNSVSNNSQHCSSPYHPLTQSFKIKLWSVQKTPFIRAVHERFSVWMCYRLRHEDKRWWTGRRIDDLPLRHFNRNKIKFDFFCFCFCYRKLTTVIRVRFKANVSSPYLLTSGCGRYSFSEEGSWHL